MVTILRVIDSMPEKGSSLMVTIFGGMDILCQIKGFSLTIIILGVMDPW